MPRCQADNVSLARLVLLAFGQQPLNHAALSLSANGGNRVAWRDCLLAEGGGGEDDLEGLAVDDDAVVDAQVGVGGDFVVLVAHVSF